MKKATVLMGLTLAAAVLIPSATPAPKADIPVAPSFQQSNDVAYMVRGNDPVDPTQVAYMARGNKKVITQDIPVSPVLAYMARGNKKVITRDIPVAPADVAYMARGNSHNKPTIG